MCFKVTKNVIKSNPLATLQLGSHYFIIYSFVLVQPQLKELCHHVSCVAFGTNSCLVVHKFEKASYEIEEEKERMFCE